MAIDKTTPSEGGSGGKRGHSNMHYYGSNDEAKDNARKKRRLDSKSEIQAQLNNPSDEAVFNSDFDPYAAIQDIWTDAEVQNPNIDVRLAAIANYPVWKQSTYLILVSEGLISNGGTPALFYNDGCMVPAIAKAYEAIGAIQHAKWIRNLMSLFGEPYPMELDKINDLLAEIPEQPWDDSSDFYSNNKNQAKLDELLQSVYIEST
jgi:Domain of unknown function (DUF4375)